MNILLVAATKQEIEPFLNYFDSETSLNIKTHNITVLITGVGMTASAFALGKALAANNYQLAINAGIAGAFDHSLKIGEVVSVKSDCFAELGAEDGEQFLSLEELGLGSSGMRPTSSLEHALINNLKSVKSITVNKVHGNDESIYNTSNRLNPQTESMEGAAFFYACNQDGIACVQLRAISNYVERRNRDNWNVPLAIQNLNATLIELLNTLP